MIVELTDDMRVITQSEDPQTIGCSSLSQLWNRDAISDGPHLSGYKLSDVFREPKARTPSSSIPKMRPLGRTTWPYHRNKPRMQHCGFVMDQGVRAIFETFFVIGHLETVFMNVTRRESNYERIFLISLLTKYCNEASKNNQKRRFLRLNQTHK
jgi:hypothetical protein